MQVHLHTTNLHCFSLQCSRCSLMISIAPQSTCICHALFFSDVINCSALQLQYTALQSCSLMISLALCAFSLQCFALNTRHRSALHQSVTAVMQSNDFSCISFAMSCTQYLLDRSAVHCIAPFSQRGHTREPNVMH